MKYAQPERAASSAAYWTTGPRRLVLRASGFTLIEVMGALLILSVAMISALRLSTASTARLLMVDRKAEAVRLAVESADSLADLPYASLAVGEREQTITRGALSWRVRETVTQWSPRVRRVQISVLLASDTAHSGSVTAYRTDPW